jgi:AraC-like DNA-binding protein
VPIPLPPSLAEIIPLSPHLDGWVFVHRWAGRLHHRHRHAVLEINLGLQGAAVNDLGVRRYPIGPGVLTWLFPGQDHQLVEQSPDFTMWVAVFDAAAVRRRSGNGLPIPAGNDPPGHHSRRLADEDARDLAALFHALRGMQGDPPAANAGFEFLLRTAWAMHRRAPELPGEGAVHPAVAEAARLLAERPDLGGEELAGRSGLSRARLSRLFHLQLGETILARRERIRIEAFLRRRQARPGGSLLTDALAAGFGSYAQFHRAFRRILGVSPRVWSAGERHYGGTGAPA